MCVYVCIYIYIYMYIRVHITYSTVAGNSCSCLCVTICLQDSHVSNIHNKQTLCAWNMQLVDCFKCHAEMPVVEIIEIFFRPPYELCLQGYTHSLWATWFKAPYCVRFRPPSKCPAHLIVHHSLPYSSSVYNLISYDETWSDVAWHDMACHRMCLYDMTCHDTIW